MSTLAHVFEAAGLATVTLGIVREQLVGTAPPRGLYVDFPLGRPLGRPNDSEFQQRVLDHAFALLESDAQVVEAFREPVRDEGAVLACPIPATDQPDAHPAVAEARGLRAAYDRSVAKGVRLGAFRVVEPDDVPSALEAFGRVATGTPWKEAGIPGIPARVAQDIRGYYEAAAVELAEHTPAAFEATRWFLRNTEAGKLMVAAREQMKADGVKQPIWQFLITEQHED